MRKYANSNPKGKECPLKNRSITKSRNGRSEQGCAVQVKMSMQKSSSRKGLGKGQGKGYKNMMPYDSHVHYLAGKGVTIYQPVFAGQKLTHLPLEVTLYIPSTLRDQPVSLTEFKRRTSDAEKKMSELFGGFTRTETQGGWVDRGGNLIEEPVATVTAFTTTDGFEAKKAEFEDYVKEIQDKYRQDAISIEFEGDLYMTR